MSRTRGSRRGGDRGLRGAHVGVVAEAGGDERGGEVARALAAVAAARRRASAAAAARRPTARRASGRRRRRRASPARPRRRSRRPTAGCRRGSSSCRRAGRRSSAARSCRGVSEPSSPSIPSSGPGGEQALADQRLGGDVGLGDEVGRAALRLDPQLGRRTPSRSCAPASRAISSASSISHGDRGTAVRPRPLRPRSGRRARAASPRRRGGRRAGRRAGSRRR